MKIKIAILALASSLTTPAVAGKIDLSEYKTVAVQPVLSASNTRGQFESTLAAAASELMFTPERAASVKERGVPAESDQGFGFAGHAHQSDIALLSASITLGMLPAGMKIDSAQLAQKVPELKRIVAQLEGKVSPNVTKALHLALDYVGARDFQNATKAILVAMAISADSITKGSERQHGYVAVGLYTGLSAMFVAAGQPNKALADLASPLVMLLEQDAVMGGADRAVAAQLELVAAELTSPMPDYNKLRGVIAAMDAVKPD